MDDQYYSLSDSTTSGRRTRKFPCVAIVILIHTESDIEYLCRSIISLRHSSYSERAVVIVDNNSGLSESLPRDFPDATVLPCPKNLGFAGGANVGINYSLGAGASYILMLNVDAVVAPDTIATLVHGMERHPDAGAVQPLIFNFDRPELIDSAGQQPLAKGGARDLTAIVKEQKEDVEIFGPCAAVAMYRRSVFERIGAFDSSFFVIHEDTDLSMRMRLEGYRSYLIPSAVAYHTRGVSGQIAKRDLRNVFYTGRNNVVLLLRYWPLKYIVLYFPFHLVRYCRVIWSGVNCGFKLYELHQVLFQAFRQRRYYIKCPRLREVQENWIAKKRYWDMVSRFFHQ